MTVKLARIEMEVEDNLYEKNQYGENYLTGNCRHPSASFHDPG